MVLKGNRSFKFSAEPSVKPRICGFKYPHRSSLPQFLRKQENTFSKDNDRSHKVKFKEQTRGWRKASHKRTQPGINEIKTTFELINEHKHNFIFLKYLIQNLLLFYKITTTFGVKYNFCYFTTLCLSKVNLHNQCNGSLLQLQINK